MNAVRRTKRAAFTLVELLVVIGIGAVLISTLMPALSQARRQANALICESNLRQWGMATRMYAEGNDGFLPRRGQGTQPTTNITRPSDWFNALPPVLKMTSFDDLVTANQMSRPADHTIWSCPEATDARQQYFWSYGMNMWLSTWNAPNPDRMFNVGPPNTMVLFADGPGNYCSVLPSNAAYTPVARHNGRVNLCFLDGHVASLPGEYVGCGVGIPARPDIRWIVPNSVWTGP